MAPPGAVYSAASSDDFGRGEVAAPGAIGDDDGSVIWPAAARSIRPSWPVEPVGLAVLTRSWTPPSWIRSPGQLSGRGRKQPLAAHECAAGALQVAYPDRVIRGDQAGVLPGHAPG